MTANSTFTWADQSGHGNDATASSNLPTKANGTPSGGATVHFGGASMLQVSSLTIDSFTYLVTIKGTNAAGAGLAWERSTNANSNTGEYSASTSGLGSNCHVRRLTTNIDSSSEIANLYQDGVWHWIAFTFDAASAGLAQYRDSTTPYGTTAAHASDSQAEPLFIGARSGLSFPFTGDFREFAVFPRVLSGAELSTMLAYMQPQIQ